MADDGQAGGHRLAGRWTEALTAYREVERFSAPDPWLLNNIGTCRASLEDYEQAAGYFDRALRLQPDFPEARLNIGFLRACQGRDAEAVDIIAGVVQDRSLDPATRQAAATLRDNLGEQQRLESFLQYALQSGDVTALQRALGEAPPSLGRPHEPSLTRLRTLAERCRNLAFNPEEFCQDAGAVALPLVEACLHARLDGGAPDKRPGHYKVTTNAIKGLPLTPAENVAGTYRALLSELLPAVPEGLPRGLLLFNAVNMIHGFADGNGRLARFLLAWEAESAGLSPIVIPKNVQKQVALALDVAWLEGELQPLLEALRLAHAETGRLLREFPASGTDTPA